MELDGRKWIIEKAPLLKTVFNLILQLTAGVHFQTSAMKYVKSEPTFVASVDC